jgi:D-3-phosphoglycerate dehydrogenase
VGTALGNAGVNIADMDVGRSQARSAIMVLATSEATPASLIEQLRAAPGILSVHVLVGE